MGLLSDVKIDVGSVFSGAGQLAKDIRTALTGKEPIDANKAAELAMKAQDLANKLELGEQSIEVTKLSIALAEAQSQDKWTSRGRPTFLYVMYLILLASIPMGIVQAFDPALAGNISIGFGSWLKAIPDELYWLFGAGYLGYTGARSIFDKRGKA